MNENCFDELVVLETERLILRPITELDAKYIFNIFSDPEVAKFDWFYPIEDTEIALKMIRNYYTSFTSKEEITWGIQPKGSDELIGICCLGDFEVRSRRAVIGYDLAQKEWNKGYATEAVKVLVDYGINRMELNRIEAFITPGNDASVRVLEKLNFTREGLVRERDLIKGELVDGIIMAILKKDLLREEKMDNKRMLSKELL